MFSRWTWFLIVVALLGLLAAVFGHAQSDFVKYGGNPVLSKPLIWCPVHAAEPSGDVRDGVLNLWFRACDDGDATLFYTNSSDGVNFSAPVKVNISHPVSYPYVLGDGVARHVFGVDTNTGRFFHEYSLHTLDFSSYCIDGVHGIPLWSYNPGVYYHNDTGVWELLLEHPGFMIALYNSSDGCNFVFVKENAVGEQGGNPDIRFYNGTYYVSYSPLYHGLGIITVVAGPSLSNLSRLDTNILCGVTQSWEYQHNSDITYIENPTPSGNLTEGVYVYYSGNQVDLGLATDPTHRSLEDIFEDRNTTRVCPPVIGTNQPVYTGSRSYGSDSYHSGGHGGGYSPRVNNTHAHNLTLEEQRAEDKRVAFKEYMDSLKKNQTNSTAQNVTILLDDPEFGMNPTNHTVGITVFASMQDNETAAPLSAQVATAVPPLQQNFLTTLWKNIVWWYNGEQKQVNP